MAYVTLAEYRAYMQALTQGTPASYTAADDAFQSQLLTSAQAFIERATQRTFEARTETRAYDATAIDYNDPALLMVDDDLLTVTTLTNGDGSVIPAAGYSLIPRNSAPRYGVSLKSSYVWTFNTDGLVSIAGTWGYMATADADVKRWTMRLAYLEQQRRTATGQVAILENGEKVYEAAVPQDIAKWLQSMRRI